uniref:Uncharacterized protein n=1 Tax=Solanum lycopersicum TaxID=4081 RepID=A0A3Q7FUZ4_SOLLC
MGVVQFDTTKNRFVAAVDDFSIKFSDVDHPVSRLICTNSGDAILVLASNAINLLCFVQECLLCDINIWWKDLFVQHDDIQGITRLSSIYFYP